MSNASSQPRSLSRRCFQGGAGALACYAHASQSPDSFYALQETIARMRGIESGHRQAEGFIRHIQSAEFSLPPTE